jgi:acetolactate synthase-1/2/3 large subunit
MPSSSGFTSSHALLATLVAEGIDRVFLVPGESYLGILDALADFPEIDVVTCRHEEGAAYMACADARLTGRLGVALVSRGPGATHAAIGLHTAEQDAIPLLLVVGQVPVRNLRRGAFQEIDYRQMYGSITKGVWEVTEPERLAATALQAIRVATSGAPGPVVLAVPEDVQQQRVDGPPPPAALARPRRPDAASVARARAFLARAQRPLLIAGGALEVAGGREALLRLAEAWQLPVVVSFRRHDLFPNSHPLFVGDLGLANPADQIAAFDEADLVLALGTRLGDITTQSYTFPRRPRPRQTLVHCYPDERVPGRHFATDVPLACSPVALAELLCADDEDEKAGSSDATWAPMLRNIHLRIAGWPKPTRSAGVAFVDVIRSLAQQMPPDAILCLDAGMFGAPLYRHLPIVPPHRLLAPISGAMGYGVPAAIASALRSPARKVICLVGDGGFAMTGSEMIAAVERKLPILFLLSNNDSYGSIRAHQERLYPGRFVGTSLTNPDFVAVARAFGMPAARVSTTLEIPSALARGLGERGPYLIEVTTAAPIPTSRVAPRRTEKHLDPDEDPAR